MFFKNVKLEHFKDISTLMRDNNDVVVVAIGLHRAPVAELINIATNDDFVFYTKEFKRIWNFFSSVTEKLCTTKGEIYWYPSKGELKISYLFINLHFASTKMAANCLSISCKIKRLCRCTSNMQSTSKHMYCFLRN